MFNFKLEDGLKVKFTKWGLAKEGFIKIDCYGCKVIDDCEKIYCPEEVHDLRPAEGFYPVMGDILVGVDGHERKVLGVCGNAYFLSNRNFNESACSVYFTREELIKESLKIKGQIETITLEEAEERLGVRIEKV